MIGESDEMDIENQTGTGSGIFDKMIGSMVKQLSKDLAKMDGMNGSNIGKMPSGFRIQISTGMPPQMNPIAPTKKEKKVGIQEFKEEAGKEEIDRRKILPRENANSSVKRLSDRIIYEILIPGVKSKKDVIISKMENSIEVRAYSKEKCYIKTIPMKVEILGFNVEEDKLFLELKS